MGQSPHILIVDDQRDIRDLLARYLIRHGFRATVAESAEAARKLMRAAQIDLIVLDIMMPGEDGLSLTRSVRENFDIPVILLTAMGDETDRIVGLEIGADDYLPKPFNPRELLARIRAVLRRARTLPRSQAPGKGKLCFDRWKLDLARRELLDERGVGVALSNGEFRLLVALLERPGMVLTRDQLLDLTRGRSAQPFDRSVDNQVSRLRRKIERDPKNPSLIKTAWGGGYSFAGEVSRL
ncbi:MAG: response regulator [Pseudomonadota bacterium]|nr:response regulator [Pseudomonadota bacterium]